MVPAVVSIYALENDQHFMLSITNYSVFSENHPDTFRSASLVGVRCGFAGQGYGALSSPVLVVLQYNVSILGVVHLALRVPLPSLRS